MSNDENKINESNLSESIGNNYNQDNSIKNDFNENNSVSKKIIIIPFAVLIILTLIIFMLSAKTCLLQHEYRDATCESPKTCLKCGESEGNPLGHNWIEATCENPKTCKRCGKIEGEPLAHTIENKITTKKATCTENGLEEGICTVCGNKVTQEIPASHSWIDDKITKPATPDYSGEKVRKCTVCGETTNISYYLSDTEIANINLVKNNKFNDYPSKTIGNAFNDFFANPTWTADGNMVAFRGNCTWLGDTTTALIGFNVDGNQFELGVVRIGDMTFDNYLDFVSLLNKIYYGIG